MKTLLGTKLFCKDALAVPCAATRPLSKFPTRQSTPLKAFHPRIANSRRSIQTKAAASVAAPSGDGDNNFLRYQEGQDINLPRSNPQSDSSKETPEHTVHSSASSSSSDGKAGESSEHIYNDEVSSGIFDKIRGILFFAWSLLLSIPLFVTMLAMVPFVMLFDKYKRLAQHFVNQVWAKVSTSLFYPVEVVGRDNLPPADKAVVYVANHQSFLDIYSLFHLDRPFKFISKTSNFLIPIVGWSMFMTGHVALNRSDRRSQLECLKNCVALLKQGAPVLFFPEGTRSKTGVMAGFKKGAFSVAGKAGVDVVPVSLLGTGSLMPSGREGVLRPGAVKIVVHRAISTRGRDMGEVCNEARQAIASALPAEYVGDAHVMNNE